MVDGYRHREVKVRFRKSILETIESKTDRQISNNHSSLSQIRYLKSLILFSFSKLQTLANMSF